MNKVILTRKELEQLIADDDTSIRFAKKKANLNSSYLWEYFHIIYVNNHQQPFVSCNSCKVILAFTSANGTNNLKSHLKSCSKATATYPSAPFEQKTIHSFYSSSKPVKISKTIRTSVMQACSEFAALDGRAFATMKGTGFQNLAQVLFDAGRSLSNSSIQIEDILPHPTTVNRIFFVQKCLIFSIFF